MANGEKHVRVVGAGPAGLMAAEVLASGGARVTIIDHHQSPGRKFLLAGRGGLNLTHSEPLDTLLDRYGEAMPRLEAAIRSFPPPAVRDWCAGLGIETFVGSSGRVFPVGLKASPLLRAWLRRLDGLGVKLATRTAWQGFDDVPTILAMGGASWPELGSNAAWVPIFEHAGISVTSLRPSNSRQTVVWSDIFKQRFAGHPIKNLALTAGGKTVRGEVMITRDGIEGGAVYALSGLLRDGAPLQIDLKPDLASDQVAARMQHRRGKDSRSNFLRKAFNLKPPAIAVMREANAEDPKSVVVTVSGAQDMRRAISTAGGVSLSEVDTNYRLLKQPSTWVVGEMLDWDAPTGGYLLQACFSTARWAAKDCLRRAKITTD